MDLNGQSYATRKGASPEKADGPLIPPLEDALQMRLIAADAANHTGTCALPASSRFSYFI
jgi:hypothetical protein